MNKDKSCAMSLGNIDINGTVEYGISFVKSIKILGIWFSNEKAAASDTDNLEIKLKP